jgi:hypothetical protein
MIYFSSSLPIISADLSRSLYPLDREGAAYRKDFFKREGLEAGINQEEVARRLETRSTVISRIENHVEDIKLSTSERVAGALGKFIQISIA